MQTQYFKKMSKKLNMVVVVLAIGLVLMSLTGQCFGELQIGYYTGKCKNNLNVEATVRSVIQSWFSTRDQTIAAALLRMQFHDCFVNGCDASILLDGSNSEKTATPDLSVRGYDIIDAVKAQVEKDCPGVVSCADIIVMATRDAVSMSGGLWYKVQTGRKDGVVSLASNVNLPSPRISVSDSIKAFGNKGLNATDMVYLLGGHTVGTAHCSFFNDRLYNFQNTKKPDPTMDTFLLNTMRFRCPQNLAADNTANLDQNPFSSFKVDNSFYRQIVQRRGILQIDQELALDPLTKATVQGIASGVDFSDKFGQAMVKLGATEVLTGSQGEIRTSCQAINMQKKDLNTLLLN